MKNLEKLLESKLIRDYYYIPLSDLGYEDEEGDRLVVNINTTDELVLDIVNKSETIEKELEKHAHNMEILNEIIISIYIIFYYISS